jgi:hypothetical protein
MNSSSVNDSVVKMVPAHLREMVAGCPQSGDGVHRWLFLCARQLHSHLSPENIERVLAEAVADCGRDVPDREISDAVRNSDPANRDISNRIPAWPKPDPVKIEEVVRRGPSSTELAAMKPVSVTRERDFVAELFPGDPLLCCGWSKTQCATRRRSQWGPEIQNLQFIVPSPMSRQWGRTKGVDGHPSQRCLDNTGPRHYLVVECDFTEASSVGSLVKRLGTEGVSPIEMCAAVLWELGKYGPLTMIVHSGGKSLHGWFHCLGVPEDHLLRFMRLAVSLGADPATWTRCQLVRMPNGLRPVENGVRTRQQVIYFDPEGGRT